MKLRATLIGNARTAVESEIKAVSGALKRAVGATGKQVQTTLRAQARSAGFKDGGRSLANAWRLNVYPPAGVGPRTWRPVAEVTSNMPDVALIFDRGALIRAKGGKYLAWPSGYNATGGRRNAGRRGGVRVTTQEMVALGKKKPPESFIIRAKTNPNVLLWCLKIYEARGLTKRSRAKIIAGRDVEVFTGNRKGRAQRARELLKQGFVVMFFLKKTVVLRKRIDIEEVRAQAAGWFQANALRELGAISTA